MKFYEDYGRMGVNGFERKYSKYSVDRQKISDIKNEKFTYEILH